MKYLYSDSYNTLIKNMEIEMKELKHPYVGTEHFLLAFLKNKNNSIVNLLNEYGLNYDKFKDILLRYIGIGNIHYDYILYTPLLRKIIDNSIYYPDDNFIDDNCLFFSFCFSDDGIAKSLLKIMGIDVNCILNL